MNQKAEGKTEGKIDSFNGRFRFLSNFYPCSIPAQGLVFRSAEHAYQAAKSDDPSVWKMFSNSNPQPITAGEAKKWGRAIKMRDNFDNEKLEIMKHILRLKFFHEDLRQWLDKTDNNFLEEGNYWNDTYWGVCRGVGQNHLGKILMEIRDENRHENRR